MLEHDVKNEVLLYLVFFLIGTYKQGLNIGSGLSQFLCNYYLSKAYVYVLSLHKTRKHRDGTTESKRLVFFCIFYMDDILLIGAREADVKRAARALEKYLLKEYGLTIKRMQTYFRLIIALKPEINMRITEKKIRQKGVENR